MTSNATATNAAMPSPHQQPREFLQYLYQAAVQRALPLHNTAACLPQPPSVQSGGRTIVWLKPAPRAATPVVAGEVSYAMLQPVLAQRCYMCHGEQVQMKNVRIDSPEGVKLHAQAIYQQVVVSKIMPMNNSTKITEDERALIGRWFERGAAVR